MARRNDVHANLLFTWRRRYGKQVPGTGSGSLVPVVVTPSGDVPPGRMEIALTDGSRVIVDREVDGAALGRVLAALGRR